MRGPPALTHSPAIHYVAPGDMLRAVTNELHASLLPSLLLWKCCWEQRGAICSVPQMNKVVIINCVGYKETINSNA